MTRFRLYGNKSARIMNLNWLTSFLIAVIASCGRHKSSSFDRSLFLGMKSNAWKSMDVLSNVLSSMITIRQICPLCQLHPSFKCFYFSSLVYLRTFLFQFNVIRSHPCSESNTIIRIW